MILIDDISKSFGALKVLDRVSLQVERGEVLCLIGASGSGKSTLLQCVNGLEAIDSGRIEVDGVVVHRRGTDLNKLRQNIGIVFQQYNVFPHLTALQNVAMPLRIVKQMRRCEAESEAERQLAYVGLDAKAAVYPGKLSGGQQQRLAIARALALRPKYMLLDEITSALDPSLIAEVLQTLCRLRSDGMTMLIVTHEVRFACEIGDKVAYFDSGVIAEIGDARQVINAPRDARTAKFLEKVLK